MSWTDNIALDTICKLRDEFYIKNFIETGTYLGDSVELALKVGFEKIISIELLEELQIRNIKKLLDKLGHRFDWFYGESDVVKETEIVINDAKSKNSPL